MSKPDAVLIVGASLLQVPMILEARALGLLPLVTDRDCNAPGVALAEHWYPVDTYDAKAHAALVPFIQKNYTLLGVATCGADVAPAVSAAAKTARTPGIPYMTAMKTHDKGTVRSLLRNAGFQRYQPGSVLVTAADPGSDIANWFHVDVVIEDELCGYPVVLKPLQQRASRGVSIIPSIRQLEKGIRHVLTYGEEYLVEQCLSGSEHSAEIIMNGTGALTFFNVVDRFFDYGTGVPIELGHVNPSNLTVPQRRDILAMLQAAAHTLGVAWGPFKCDVMWTTDGPKILECTARLSGGFDCQRTTPLSTGRNPIRQVLMLACGLPVEESAILDPCTRYAACAAILSQQTGRLYRLPTLNDIDFPQHIDHVDEVIWCVREGDMLAPAQHNGERAGFVITVADTYALAWKQAAYAARRLGILMGVQV